MRIRTGILLTLASAVVAVAAAGCGGSGGGATAVQAVLPEQYVLETFPLPAQEVTIVGVLDDSTVKMKVRDYMFFRWTPSEGRVLEYTTSDYPSRMVADESGRVAFDNGSAGPYLLANGAIAPITDSGGSPAQGSPIGFSQGEPVLARTDGSVWSRTHGSVVLQRPSRGVSATVEATSVGPDGRIAGSVHVIGEGRKAAVWDQAGRLTELGQGGQSLSSNRLSKVFAGGDGIGTIEGTNGNALAAWSASGDVQFLVRSNQYISVDGTSDSGFAVGYCDAFSSKTFVWSAASGVKSLADMTTGFPADAKSHRIYYPKVSAKGIIAGLIDVSDLSNPNAPPVWRGVVLRPVRQ